MIRYCIENRVRFNSIYGILKLLYDKFQVGVALLVGMLFMINVGVELMCISISEKLSEKFNRQKTPDIEDLDPASLVGSFKRYK